MTSTRVGKRTALRSLLATRLAVVALALFGPLGAASRAHADAADDTYLATLQADGITHVSPEAAIEAGHKVCEYLEQGTTMDQVVYDDVYSSRLPPYNSDYIGGASTRVYCPQHVPET